jgi:hypothetical protein
VLYLQIMVLTLIPLLPSPVPGDAVQGAPFALLGIGEGVTREFMLGTWKYSDEFCRWGATDKERARIKPFSGSAFMSLRDDGTAKMLNLFRPADARWRVSEEGIVVFLPDHPERSLQELPIRKRDQDRIWVLLPFTGGASGIGMIRVGEEEMLAAEKRLAPTAKTPQKKPLRTGTVEDQSP